MKGGNFLVFSLKKNKEYVNFQRAYCTLLLPEDISKKSIIRLGVTAWLYIHLIDTPCGGVVSFRWNLRLFYT